MPVNIFFCYAREDEPLLTKLKSHLVPLKRQGLIDFWYDREISAGAEWEHEISQQLNMAQIILLLVRPDFMNSDYINNVELKRAIERHERGEARVIPVILEYVYWQIDPLRKLQVLPTDGKPITGWDNKNEAFYNVTEGIRKVVIEDRKAQEMRLLNLEEAEQIKSPSASHEIPISANQTKLASLNQSHPQPANTLNNSSSQQQSVTLSHLIIQKIKSHRVTIIRMLISAFITVLVPIILFMIRFNFIVMIFLIIVAVAIIAIIVAIINRF